MKLVLTQRATRRLSEIADHIHAENPAAARDVQRAIRAAFALLATYPYAGRAVTPDIRIFAVPRLPYLIYYQVEAKKEEVRIVTLRHAAQRRLI